MVSKIYKSDKNKSDCNGSIIKRYIIITLEFYDDFNPCNGNNTNNSVTLHNLSIISIDSTMDSNEFTYPVTIGHKHPENMIKETAFIESLN